MFCKYNASFLKIGYAIYLSILIGTPVSRCWRERAETGSLASVIGNRNRVAEREAGLIPLSHRAILERRRFCYHELQEKSPTILMRNLILLVLYNLATSTVPIRLITTTRVSSFSSWTLLTLFQNHSPQSSAFRTWLPLSSRKHAQQQVHVPVINLKLISSCDPSCTCWVEPPHIHQFRHLAAISAETEHEH